MPGFIACVAGDVDPTNLMAAPPVLAGIVSLQSF
jgi:hypothetical protein